MGARKVEIPVDPNVREYLRKGKGDLTWDEYLTSLKKIRDEVVKSSKVRVNY